MAFQKVDIAVEIRLQYEIELQNVTLVKGNSPRAITKIPCKSLHM